MKTPSTAPLLPRLLLAASLLACGFANAGRPLTVDDANTDDAGSGHVEGWYARQPGRANTFTVAPAYAPIDGLELGASVTRDRTAASTSQSLQAKWRITPSLDNGCNPAAVLGASQTRGQSGTTPYLNGLLTCNSALGSTHVNLGAQRASGGPGVGTWGLAHEREWGPVTVHAEAFGQRLAKPTFQIGARKDLSPSLQLDATLGRNNRQGLVSVGFKQSF
ncbi:MAG: hypothetical protein Q8K71_00870 [Polaromonas sp.]|uniref:hypothetical protein n=1 Tax=Polaromonas sp. TaxID=1869339 RepID=UPI0027302924|nr:hypothetical protein [Polaromonas sp.]MDP1742286.1 hypothetical protein [Polaromonas sp.]MDP1953013.1 hypothetical protein [Polaromonas sp.]MDP3751859.1 hypothetical protein [Polaromonas sp.]